MKFLAALLLMLTAPTAAIAYIGPGAGLSLLGALWALIAAMGLAIAFVVAWPVRKMLRRKRLNPPAQVRSGAQRDDAAPRSPPATSRS